MGATLSKDGTIWVVTITGMLRKEEMEAIQFNAVENLSSETGARFLVLVEDFQGWHRGDSWGDDNFISDHGDRIEKMAIVAEVQWKDRLLMFAGAGFRATEIEFYPPEKIETARAWLAE